MAFTSYRSGIQSIVITDIKNDYNIIKAIDKTEEFINPMAAWPYLIVSNSSFNYVITVWDIYDTHNITPIGKLTGHTKWLINILYCTKRNLLIYGSLDFTIRVWNINDYKCVRTITQLIQL
jgi:WD40 repeat protein